MLWSTRCLPCKRSYKSWYLVVNRVSCRWYICGWYICGWYHDSAVLGGHSFRTLNPSSPPPRAGTCAPDSRTVPLCVLHTPALSPPGRSNFWSFKGNLSCSTVWISSFPFTASASEIDTCCRLCISLVVSRSTIDEGMCD